MSASPDQIRAWATINLGAIERNLRAIRRALPAHLRYISVVKANAYGHGLAPVVTRLMQARVDLFAVANLDEAAQIREVGTGWPILILSVLLPSEYEEALHLKVLPILSSPAEVEAFGLLAAKRDQPFAFHLKVDSGMGRLGVWYPEVGNILQLIRKFPHLRLEGLCTHLSSADTDTDFTQLQRQRFKDCLKLFSEEDLKGVLVHADNSAGLESFPTTGPFNAARVGLAQFGIRPKPGSFLSATLVEPVLSFHARVGLIKHLPAGVPISYGQTHKLRRDSRIAILTAGYADGLSTSLSNRGQVIVKDSLCPILGRVTMDQTIVDITDVSGPVEPGEVATFIGTSPSHEISVSQYALWSGQIEWEVLCSLSARTRRIYQKDSLI